MLILLLDTHYKADGKAPHPPQSPEIMVQELLYMNAFPWS